jgi:FlaA1/EpsC-like NDP-sugar epimerase
MLAPLSLAHRVRALPPLQRRVLLLFADALLLLFAAWLSFWLRLADPWSPLLLRSLWLLPASVLIGLPLYGLTGQYKGLTRYTGSMATYRLAGRNGLLVLLLSQLGVLLQLPLPPRSSWLLLWLLLTGLTGVLRFALRDLLLGLQVRRRGESLPVAIYGAGSAGAQLAAALRLSGNYTVVVFLDDDPQLWKRTINGVKIRPQQWLIDHPTQVQRVLLAIPSLTRNRRKQILDGLQALDLAVLQVPSLQDVTTGRARIDTLRPIEIEELLGRDVVPPDPQLLGPGIAGRCICVTGAGGSIGSELCRQILRWRPRCVLLLDASEPSLYAIHQELNAGGDGLEFVPLLGNAADQPWLERALRQHRVDLVFHAAAYKHVPLVEANPLVGLSNNVLATRTLCQAAASTGVQQVVLISTDKAVRPTNVMGASKRVAELVVQAWAQQSSTTRFAMVRFGNVLGSSGSVVPLFRRQIAAGGPITLTHPEIVRYFMTIPEAAQLVLQAAQLAQGGDVFLLDMGDPVRIRDLAEQMVRLSGLSIRDAEHPDGDLEIVCTGLRPGEKLFEELLIDADSRATPHPLIYRARERSITPARLWPQLDALQEAIGNQDVEAALRVLSQLVPEWQRGC